MSQTKKIIIVCLAAAGLLILVGLDFYHYLNLNNSTSNNPSAIQNSKNKKLLSNEDIAKATQTIIQSANAAQCASVKQIVNGVDYETVCRNSIAWNAAQTNLDLNACKGLDNKLMSIADCQNSVIAKLVNKEKNLSACDQFTEMQKNTCVSDYWLSQAAGKNDPGLCKNITSTQAEESCENNVLLSNISIGNSQPNCSLFTDPAKTDCTNYVKHNCQALTFLPLRDICLRTKIK